MRPRPFAAVLLLALLVVAGGARAAESVDPSPPTIGDKPPAVTASRTATFSFSHPELAVFQCSLDGAGFASCTSPATYASLAEGGHTFAVRAVDAGGVPSAPATYSWRVDVTPPELSIVSPAHGSAVNTVSPVVSGIGGTAVGDLPTVRLQVRQGTGGGQPIRTLTAAVDPVTGAWSVAVTPALAEGTYNVKAEQSDDAGNTAETDRNTFSVNLTPPVAPSVSGPPPRTGSASAQITFSHPDPGVSFLCRLDGGAEEPCTSPKVYSGLGEGGHTVEVRARDAAGNLGPAASHSWTVDLTPPPVSLVSPANGTVTSNVSPLVSGTGGTAVGDSPTVQVEVRQGGAPIRALDASVNPATGAWSVTVAPALPEGTYTVRAAQSDDVGNTAQSASVTFSVQLALPSIGLSSPAHGTVRQNRFPSFAGTSDASSVRLEIFAGSPNGGAPLHTVDVAVAAGAWSVTLAEELADGIYAAVAKAAFPGGPTASSNAVTFVVDNVGPQFAAAPQGGLTFEQTARAGELVTYVVTAADALDPSPTVVCSPPSGSRFPLGVKTVTCTATDWAGLKAQIAFPVRVVNTIRPAQVAGVAARAGNGVVTVSWRRPTDWDFDRIVIRRAPRGTSKWTVVRTQRTGTSFADRKVRNDRQYVYRVTSVDLAGNVSPVATASARPSAFLVPAWGATVSGPPLLRWAKVKKAGYYNVQVWYRGRKVLSRWPAGPRLKMTAAWRFQGRRHTLKPGTYQVYAWPGYGPKARARYGRLIGWTKFVVPAKGASAAAADP